MTFAGLSLVMNSLDLLFIAMVFTSIWYIMVYGWRLHHWTRTLGQVTGYRLTREWNGGWFSANYYHPVVFYMTNAMVQHEHVYGGMNRGRPRYRTGEDLCIYYNPKKPSRFMIHDVKAEFFLACIWTAIGLALLTLSLIQTLLP
jgi:hypothetical protein